MILALAAYSGGQGKAGGNLTANAAGELVGADNAGTVAAGRNETTPTAPTTSWPASLKPFGDGYPASGDPRRRVGESPATSDYLDDSADLVGCPTDAAAAALKGRTLATVDGIRLVSVSRKTAATATAPRLPVRGKGSLEEICLAKVADITRAPVTGVNRIDETGDPIEIFVNVQGAQAPWRCEARRTAHSVGSNLAAAKGRPRRLSVCPAFARVAVNLERELKTKRYRNRNMPDRIN